MASFTACGGSESNYQPTLRELLAGDWNLTASGACGYRQFACNGFMTIYKERRVVDDVLTDGKFVLCDGIKTDRAVWLSADASGFALSYGLKRVALAIDLIEPNRIEGKLIGFCARSTGVELTATRARPQ